MQGGLKKRPACLGGCDEESREWKNPCGTLETDMRLNLRS